MEKIAGSAREPWEKKKQRKRKIEGGSRAGKKEKHEALGGSCPVVCSYLQHLHCFSCMSDPYLMSSPSLLSREKQPPPFSELAWLARRLFARPW